MRAFLRLVLFVAIGPIVGLVAMSVFGGLNTLVSNGSMRDFVFGPELFAPGILIVAYMVGGGPALLTVIGSIFIARWRTGWRGWLWTALCGAILSLMGLWVLVGSPLLGGPGGDRFIGVMVALDGGVAGFVCAALFDGLAALLRRPAVA